MKTIVHVNQHHIKANAKGAELPVLTVKDYKQNRRCNRAIIKDDEGNIVAQLIYSPDNVQNSRYSLSNILTTICK